MARQEQAGEIINRAAVDVGLISVTDPFSSTNEGFTQMAGLLNSACRELSAMFEWEELTKEFTFNTTTDVTSGYADLPADYDRFIEATGWDLDNNVAVAGPLTAQQWAYLKGRNLASNTIYVTYRINNAKIQIYPEPPPSDVDCSFRYISRYFVKPDGESAATTDYATASNDTIILDPLLVQKLLVVKFLNAKSLNSSSAMAEFENILRNRLGVNKGAQTLNIGGLGGAYPYLSGLRNLPDTNYGL